MVLVPTQDIVDRAMVAMSMTFPIFASLIIRVGYKIVNKPTEKACAWTDGTAIYINEAGVNYFNSDPIKTIPDEYGNDRQVDCTIGRDEMIFIMSHELMHLIGQTFPRGIAIGIPRYGYNKKDAAKNKMWNMATDYEINELLKCNEQNGSTTPVGRMPQFCLFSNKYHGMVAEKIYEDLAKNNSDQSQNQNSDDASSGNGNGNSSSFNDPTKNNSGDNDCENRMQGLDFGLDKHMPIADDTTQDEVAQKINEVLGGIEPGKGDSALERALKEGFKPQPFNWRKALTKYIRSWIQSNYTWNKPSRAGIANNVILPSTHKAPKIHIACAIDTSGSVGDVELKCMLDHLFTILSQFNSYTIDLWCCSTKVHEDTFITLTESSRNTLTDFRLESDGGTDLRHNFDFLEKKYKGKKPDVFILLSDFYDSMNGDTELTCNIPCVWMVMGNKNFTPPSKIKAQVFPFDVNA